jgi:hypothetical protein
VGMRGKHVQFLSGHAILQWRCGKGGKTRGAPIACEAAFFPDRGGPSFSHAVEASGGRKEEGCEQLAASTRRARGCRFEQVSEHVPRIGQGRCRLCAACRWPDPSSNVDNRRPSSRRFHIFDFFSMGSYFNFSPRSFCTRNVQFVEPSCRRIVRRPALRSVALLEDDLFSRANYQWADVQNSLRRFADFFRSLAYVFC